MARSRNGIFYPLDLVYARAGIPQPKVTEVSADEIPRPYRSLLVHESDMTVTLEEHFGDRVVLRPLSTFSRRTSYFRHVLLVEERSGRPVEMGAIRIRLDRFRPRIRAQILKNEVPLGRILRDGGVDFKSEARVFLAIEPNAEMMGIFWMHQRHTLYGRRTEVMLHGAVIGDIVEVLPRV